MSNQIEVASTNADSIGQCSKTNKAIVNPKSENSKSEIFSPFRGPGRYSLLNHPFFQKIITCITAKINIPPKA